MNINDYTEEQISPVIAYLLSGDKFEALLKFKEISKLDGVDCITGVIEIAKKYSEKFKDEEFLLKHIPEKCCKNCSGCPLYCTAKKDNFFDKSTFKFYGASCGKFMPIPEYKSYSKNAKIIIKRSVAENKYIDETIIIDNDIVKISRVVRFKGSQEAAGKMIKKHYVVNLDKFLDGIIKKKRTSVFSVNQEKSDEILHVFHKKVKKGEKYNDYINRVMKDIRKKSNEINEKVNNMSFEETLQYIFDNILTDTAKSIVSSTYSGNLYDFVKDFYPMQNPWEICLEHMKEE